MQEKDNTIQEKIIEKLKKTPKLKRSVFYWIGRTLSLPFRILVWPIRYILMTPIAPATRTHLIDFFRRADKKLDPKITEDVLQKEVQKSIASLRTRAKKQGDNPEDAEKIANEYLKYRSDYLNNRVFTEIPYKTGGLFNDCKLVLAFNRKDRETAIASRKLVITFPGNLGTMKDSIMDASWGYCAIQQKLGGLDPVEAQNKIAELKEKGNNDVMFVGYPKGATSSGEIVDAGVSAVLRALAAGYKPGNISITGFSLGGAISARVLEEMKPHLRDEKFKSCIIDKTFTNIGQAKLHVGKMSKVINGFAWLFGLQIDAEKAVKSGLPVQHKYINDGGNDTAIKTRLGISITKEETKQDTAPGCPDSITIKVYENKGHRPENGLSQFKEFKNTQKEAEEQIARFQQTEKKTTTRIMLHQSLQK